jgi:hypothetical protein
MTLTNKMPLNKKLERTDRVNIKNGPSQNHKYGKNNKSYNPIWNKFRK